MEECERLGSLSKRQRQHSIGDSLSKLIQSCWTRQESRCRRRQQDASGREGSRTGEDLTRLTRASHGPAHGSATHCVTEWLKVSLKTFMEVHHWLDGREGRERGGRRAQFLAWGGDGERGRHLVVCRRGEADMTVS